jgi:hypothetical protein
MLPRDHFFPEFCIMQMTPRQNVYSTLQYRRFYGCVIKIEVERVIVRFIIMNELAIDGSRVNSVLTIGLESQKFNHQNFVYLICFINTKIMLNNKLHHLKGNIFDRRH